MTRFRRRAQVISKVEGGWVIRHGTGPYGDEQYTPGIINEDGDFQKRGPNSNTREGALAYIRSTRNPSSRSRSYSPLTISTTSRNPSEVAELMKAAKAVAQKTKRAVRVVGRKIR